MIVKSELLRLLRSSLGKKQEDVAAAVDISTNYLSLIENGKKQPSYELMKNLAKEYGVPSTLFAWEEEDLKRNLSLEEKEILKSMSKLIDELFIIAVRKNAQKKSKLSY